MLSNSKSEAYKTIDKYLKYLNENDGGSVYDIGDDFYSTPSQIAYEIMCENRLIIFRKGYRDIESIIDISHKGISVLEMGGWESYLNHASMKQKNDEKFQKLEFEKTETDLKLAKHMLKEYPYTKWMSRVGFLVAIGLAFLELFRFLRKSG